MIPASRTGLSSHTMPPWDLTSEASPAPTIVSTSSSEPSMPSKALLARGAHEVRLRDELLGFQPQVLGREACMPRVAGGGVRPERDHVGLADAHLDPLLLGPLRLLCWYDARRGGLRVIIAAACAGPQRSDGEKQVADPHPGLDVAHTFSRYHAAPKHQRYDLGWR